jgi:hypothetical protein
MPPRLLATCRAALAPSGKTADPAAAQRGRDLVRPQQAPLQPWRPAAAPTRTRPCCVAPRRTLGQEQTRLTHRLTHGLNGDGPHVFRWVAALDTPFVGAVRPRWPPLAAVQPTHDPAVRRCFPAPQAHHPASHQPRRDAIRHARPAPTEPAVRRASVMVVHPRVEPGRGWAEAIRRGAPASAGLPHAHGDAPMFASRPGAGPVQAARVSRARGPDRIREAGVAD